MEISTTSSLSRSFSCVPPLVSLHSKYRKDILLLRSFSAKVPALKIRASSSLPTVDSHENGDGFANRMEQAWQISKQPRPIACSSCESNGYLECKWCNGTGFFIIGNNMLCEVPSRNTSCIICAGKGSACCADCKGTGFRAKWLKKPSTHV